MLTCNMPSSSTFPCSLDLSSLHTAFHLHDIATRLRTHAARQTPQPTFLFLILSYGRKKFTVLLDGVTIPHAFVARRAYRPKVFDSAFTAFTRWDIVACFKLKWRNAILAPFYRALCVKLLPVPHQPYILAHGLRYVI